MSLYKIQPIQSIHYDSYGSPLNTQILLMENILSRNQFSTGSLASRLSNDFYVIHTKQIDFSGIEISEYSIIRAMESNLEEFLNHSPGKSILIAEGYSCALSLKLFMENSTRIQSFYCVNPLFLMTSPIDSNPLISFWDWFSSQSEFIQLLPRSLFVMDFYFHYLQYTELVKREFSESNTPVHFIFSGRSPRSSFDSIRNFEQRHLISLIENPESPGSIYDIPMFQALLSHFLEKDRLQIHKD